MPSHTKSLGGFLSSPWLGQCEAVMSLNQSPQEAPSPGYQDGSL